MGIVNIAIENLELSENAAQVYRRGLMQETELRELGRSIKAVGLLHPVQVRETAQGGLFRVVAGERRVRACELAGIKSVSAVVLGPEQSDLAVQLADNLHTQTSDPITEGHGCKELLDAGTTLVGIGRKLGKSKTWVAMRLALLRLSPHVMDAVVHGDIPTAFAAQYLATMSPEWQEDNYKRFLGLSNRKASALFKHMSTPPDESVDDSSADAPEAEDTAGRPGEGADGGDAPVEGGGEASPTSLIETEMTVAINYMGRTSGQLARLMDVISHNSVEFIEAKRFDGAFRVLYERLLNASKAVEASAKPES